MLKQIINIWRIMTKISQKSEMSQKLPVNGFEWVEELS